MMMIVPVIGLNTFYHMNFFNVYTSTEDKDANSFLTNVGINCFICCAGNAVCGIIGFMIFGY